jgi:hypothetical protein
MPASQCPGYPAMVDPLAESTSVELPAFIAIPAGAPVYHGFPLIAGSEIDGWVFGVITSPVGAEPREWGDAYVVAPDGSRAGIVWSASSDPQPRVICEPDAGRWGVYGLRFRHPVRSEQDLVRNLHEWLPQLKAFYQAAETALRPSRPNRRVV